MEPKKSETSQDLAGKSEIGTLAGKSEIGSLAGKSENIGTFEIASKSGALTRSEIDLQARLARLRIMKDKLWELNGELNRKKDVVCLILSYPPFNSRNIETHRGWIRDVLEITREVRKKKYGKYKVSVSDLSMKYEVSVSDLSSKITGLLHHSIHDIEAHVPSHILDAMCGRWSSGHTTPKNAMLDLCIDDFMIRQILQNIQISEIQSILISGVNDKTFPRRLKNLPPIRQMFDLVIQVNVKSCWAIEHMQDRIIEELGFSKSSRGEAEQLLRSQNFLIFLDGFNPWMVEMDLHDLGNGWWNSDTTQKIVLMGYSSFSVVPVADLEIRGSHHLLSWELFCKNVGEVMSSIQQLAVHLLRQCSGHLLATVLMARALKDVKNVRIWQHASRVIGCLPTSHAEDRILFNALAFVLEHLGSANKCVKYCASHLEMEGTYRVDLLDSWMKEDLIKTLNEGEKIVQHLVNALLLESFQNGESIRMRKEIRKELVNFYEAEMNPIPLVELDGRGLMEAPKNETWEEANEMYLMNNKISKLLDNPNCPKLSALFLQAEVGEFCHLEVLDLEGTEIINLPVSIGKLTNLTCLKVSFYPQANGNRKNNLSNRIIPQNVISSLLQLEELSIDVNPEDERWNATIKDIVEEVCCLNRLHFLKLHLPEVLLLNDLRNGSSLINLSRMHFRFIVGNHLKRIISRLPHESAIKFEEQESCLKYVNGKDISIEIKEILQHATAFFLDRHLSATSLSEFGIENKMNLKCCVLQECSEIKTIVDANDHGQDIVLESLEYLSLHYMKNLRSIWKGPPPRWRGPLHFLKVLALYSCPNLTNTFTLDLAGMLNKLEELVVEDCPEMTSIVGPADGLNWGQREQSCLPNLKKISLHYLPKLVSIFGNVLIAPSLEWLSFYDCPSLKILFSEEVSSHKLKVIIGEADWWSALNESERFLLQNLGAIFFPIERDIDLRTQLAEINDQLQAQMQETEPSQQSGLDDSLENPAVEVETSSKQKQVA
ncbi:disease resistance protein RPS2-like [Vitis riparia]|uniref:disease resistance protein RPS2-like n=1 Tax=Vitis riparia TaxID=96939 RepID=UPI00155A51DA|nr:disease resistance protein RPS2-like [Vitis riparia]